jgi:hypothetical protein
VPSVKCEECGRFRPEDANCECLELLTLLQGAVGDEAMSAMEAARALIADRDAQKAYREERHQRVLELIREKKLYRDRNLKLAERVASLEARPGFWARVWQKVAG